MGLQRVIAVAVLTTGWLQCGSCQDSPAMTFEVATIRESDSSKPPRPSLEFFSNQLQVRSMTLKDLITISYDLTYGTEDQIIGGPGWIRTKRFDVIAKEEESASRRLLGLPENEQGAANRQLIRELLAERFGLKMRKENRVLTTYTLEVAKGGPKLSRGVIDPHLSADIPQNRVNVLGVGLLAAHNTDMALFVKVLGSQAEIDGHPIVDGTGLKGKFDFTLKWTPDTLSNADPFEAQATLFSAVQEQLGLKVTTKKNSVEVLSVDGVDQPSAN